MINLNFEIQLLDLVQREINAKFSKSRKIGENPVYGAALQRVCEGAEMLKDEQYRMDNGPEAVRTDHEALNNHDMP